VNTDPQNPNLPGDAPVVDLNPQELLMTAEDKELANFAMSFNLDVEAFLLEPENFQKINFDSLSMPRPETPGDATAFRANFVATIRDFFGSWSNRMYLVVAGLFLVMLVMFNPEAIKFNDWAQMRPMNYDPTPTPKPTPPPTPTPTPPPTPPPTPTPPPLEPIKLPKKNQNMKVKLNQQQRQQRNVSSATAKLNVRDTADDAMPDIDTQFTANRDDPNVSMNLDNLGAGRRGGGDKDGAPAVFIGGSRRGSSDGDLDVNVSFGNGNSRAPKTDVKASGQWVRITNPGAIAQYQVKCLNNPGTHIYGNIKIQCANNTIQAVWKRM
jgi:hypothetical protein